MVADGNAEVSRLQIAEARLTEALRREHVLLVEKEELVDHIELLSREANHRLLNGLQMVSSLLALQARQSQDLAVAAQLREAATRVVTVASVHRTLHSLDRSDRVELKGYLAGLCEELTTLVYAEGDGMTLALEGTEFWVPASKGANVGLIVSELVTNAFKHASGKITIGLASHRLGCALSVSDEGPGLPEGFDPAKTTGLGMKIVASLVKQVGGQLAIGAASAGRGAKFTVTFPVT